MPTCPLQLPHFACGAHPSTPVPLSIPPHTPIPPTRSLPLVQIARVSLSHPQRTDATALSPVPATLCQNELPCFCVASTLLCYVLRAACPHTIPPPECRASASVVSLSLALRFDETPFIAQLYHSPFDGRWPLETHTRPCEQCSFSRWEGPEGGLREAPMLEWRSCGPAAAQRRRRGWGLLCLSCSLPAVHARAGQCVPELRPSARTLPAAPARLLPPPLGALDVARSRLQAHSASSAGWAELLPQLTTQAPLPASAPGGAAVHMKPPRAFSALPNPSKAVRHFAPSWFTIVMGTGTVGVLTGVLPQ